MAPKSVTNLAVRRYWFFTWSPVRRSGEWPAMKTLRLAILSTVAILGLAPVTAVERITVTPQEDTTSLLRNPAMGWVLYLDAVGKYPNAEKYWKELDPYARYATIFYHRARWSDYEPEEGKYAWKSDANFRAMLDGARSRGLRLAFRVLVNARDNAAQATPDYVRQAGAKGYLEKGQGGEYWTPNLDDPVFQKKLEAFVAAFAAEFDDPARVDFVDGNGLGWWGEIHHLNLKPDQHEAVCRWICGIYARHFKRVLLGIQYGSEFGRERDERIAIGEFGFVIRRDGLGSHWFSKEEKADVLRRFPQVPFFGECCYASIRNWKEPWQSEGVKDHREILAWSMRDALVHHANTLDLRRPDDAKTWVEDAPELVQKFIAQGGYRLVPTRVVFPAAAPAGGACEIQHVWRNTGVGVLPNTNLRWNHKYRVAFALLNPSGGKPAAVYVDRNAEPGAWVQGKEQTGALRATLEGIKPGRYQLSLAIVDTTRENAPAIQLAVTGLTRTPEGWYVLGEMDVEGK
jgi:hypothetical protein